MDASFLKDILDALRTELIKRRSLVTLCFIAVTFSLLLIGVLLPKNYTTSAVIYVESSKIIEPLLKGNAEVNKIDRSEQASEKIYTRSNLIEAGRRAGLITDATPITQQEDIIKYLRSGIKISRERFNNQFKVAYTAKNQDESFEVLNAIVATFIDTSSEEKQAESAGAYNFIDDQAQNYKRQLELAEQRLKEFNAKNIDGTETSVNTRIYGLRQEIETLQIAIDEASAKIGGLDKQLGYEGRYIEARNTVDGLRQKKFTLVENLEKLRLSYQERHPDVVLVREQIAEVDRDIAALVKEGRGFAASDKSDNPLFEDLRRQYAQSQVEVSTKTRRIESLNELLKQEYARQERIAANQAELSELNRDYDVTKRMYDTLVERKEAARISMSLDVEGQSVSYRIREPAAFPLSPIGLRFWHLAVLGPFLGALLTLGAVVALIIVDPRIRTARALLRQLPEDVAFVGVIPHFKTPLEERILRQDYRNLFIAIVVAMAAYIALAIGWHYLYG